jgi:hypothetical protein
MRMETFMAKIMVLSRHSSGMTEENNGNAILNVRFSSRDSKRISHDYNIET